VLTEDAAILLAAKVQTPLQIGRHLALQIVGSSA
jgi:hypothetical protein